MRLDANFMQFDWIKLPQDICVQTRLQNRKVAQARRDTFQKAQMLGTILTNIGPDEFEEEFTNGATSAPTTQRVSTSASTTQVSPNAPTPIEKAT